MPGRFDVQLEAQVWMQIVGSVSLLFNLLCHASTVTPNPLATEQFLDLDL